MSKHTHKNELVLCWFFFFLFLNLILGNFRFVQTVFFSSSFFYCHIFGLCFVFVLRVDNSFCFSKNIFSSNSNRNWMFTSDSLFSVDTLIVLRFNSSSKSINVFEWNSISCENCQFQNNQSCVEHKRKTKFE